MLRPPCPSWFPLAVLATSLTAGCTLEFDECLIDGRCGDVAGRSCEGVDDVCGGARSCCSAADVPGGTFARGTDATNVGPGVVGWVGDPGQLATVSGFSMDLFEVTVARFRNFLAAYDAWRGSGHPRVGDGDLRGAGAGWQTSFPLPTSAAALQATLTCGASATFTDVPAGNEQHAMNCVDWYVAFAFCIWDGGRLPSEAEWHFAASGGDEQRAFPWSVPNDATNVSNAFDVLEEDGPQRVGARPSSEARWGHLSLGANVREWVRDEVDDADLGTYLEPCSDCVVLGSSGSRVRRGGDYGVDTFERARTTYRSQQPPGEANEFVGLRCVRSN